MTISIAPYDPECSYPGQKKFDSGHDAINSFAHNSLKQQVKKRLSVAYVLTDSERNNQFVGFYTIAQHTIDVSLLTALELGSLPRKIPCSRLIMLGVDRAYQGQRLGARLMKHALLLTKSVSKQIGSFGLYLDADPNAFGFYKALGFIALEGNQLPKPSPMFLPIAAIPEPDSDKKRPANAGP
jgi:GNAT superfamily N-acetyltransferase